MQRDAAQQPLREIPHLTTEPTLELDVGPIFARQEILRL